MSEKEEGSSQSLKGNQLEEKDEGERKKEFEVGTDLRFLQDKLSFSATYFYNRTEDVLLDFPIAQSRGYRRIFDNGGEIENKGVELDLG